MLKLTIETGNAPFEADLVGEVVDILRDAARRIEETGAADGLILRDSNGNKVGRIEWEG